MENLIQVGIVYHGQSHFRLTQISLNGKLDSSWDSLSLTKPFQIDSDIPKWKNDSNWNSFS
jgi:hypothetical protein